MFADKREQAFDDEDWIFEIKWDGYRAIAEIKENFKFYSRNGLSFIGKYSSIETDLKKQKNQMILDGEIVAYDSNFKPNFQILQHFSSKQDSALIYHVFDLLYLNGHSTTELTLMQRKELLKEALIETPHLKYCDHIEKEGKTFFDEIKKENIEGMMAKRKTSQYQIGKRSRDWIKVKTFRTDEAVIAGFTQPRGSRQKFGALILGIYQNRELVYAGHTGTGFNEKQISEVFSLLQTLIIKQMPFNEKPSTNMPPTWVEPKIVCTIKYTELTENNVFRHPVFIGIRPDISIEDLQKESCSKNKKEMNQKTKKNNNIKKDVKYTNLDKLYWNKEEITKGELIEYYQSISEYILPHLEDRAQSLNRFPDGIEGDSFFHKDAGGDAPSWVDTVKIHSESNNKELEYIVCNNSETLGYLNNLGCIDLNVWNSSVQNIDYPDYLIIDLDPSTKNTFEEVIEAALMTKEILDSCDVASYCKTSGSTGIHIFVPMAAQYTYKQVKDFAHIIVQRVSKKLTDTTTLERSLNKRGSKIYLDYLQNRKGQTVASVYSIRPKQGATVSMPLEWGEVKKGLKISDFTIYNALERLKDKGDIFKPVLGKGINMKDAIDKLEKSNN